MSQGRLFPTADGPAVTHPNLVPLFRRNAPTVVAPDRTRLSDRPSSGAPRPLLGQTRNTTKGNSDD